MRNHYAVNEEDRILSKEFYLFLLSFFSMGTVLFFSTISNSKIIIHIALIIFYIVSIYSAVYDLFVLDSFVLSLMNFIYNLLLSSSTITDYAFITADKAFTITGFTLSGILLLFAALSPVITKRFNKQNSKLRK